jgi:BirA family biotin operon repressor/biotin-[acetyl-CoA-carboxylase] ligase
MAAAWYTVLGDRPYRYFPQIGSTNDEASAWAQAGASAGSVVLADEQVAGRGRRGRQWVAAPGAALLLSMVLRPVLAPEALPRVMLLGAVALADVLAGLGLKPGIKWPNDVQLGEAKVAGILGEGVWQENQLTAVVLGIGVNVTREALPPEAAAVFHATTVETALGRPADRADLLAGLVARLDYWRGQIAQDALLDAWRGYCTMLGQLVQVDTGEAQINGTALDVDATGALLLDVGEDSPRRVLAGDVTLRTKF